MATDKNFNIARGNLAHSQGILDKLHLNTAQQSPEMGVAATTPQVTPPPAVQQPAASPFDTLQLPQTNTAAVGSTVTQPPSYNVSDRGVAVNDEDLNLLRKVLYTEIGSRSADKTDLEARTVANVALNRLKARYGDAESLSDVLTAPKQFQGYGSNLYNDFEKDSQTASGTKRLAAINKVIDEIKSGNFPDTIDGYEFYKHLPDGRINATKEY